MLNKKSQDRLKKSLTTKPGYSIRALDSILGRKGSNEIPDYNRT